MKFNKIKQNISKLVIASSLLSLSHFAFADDTQKVCFYKTLIKISDISYRSNSSSPSSPSVSSIDVTEDPNVDCLKINPGPDLSNQGDISKWVSSQMSGWGASWIIDNMVSTTSSKNTPAALRFALVISGIKLKTPGGNHVQCDNFTLGQGDITGGYNWWIFSNNNDGDQSVNCQNLDDKSSMIKLKFEEMSALSHDEFKVASEKKISN